MTCLLTSAIRRSKQLENGDGSHMTVYSLPPFEDQSSLKMEEEAT